MMTLNDICEAILRMPGASRSEIAHAAAQAKLGIPGAVAQVMRFWRAIGASRPTP